MRIAASHSRIAAGLLATFLAAGCGGPSPTATAPASPSSSPAASAAQPGESTAASPTPPTADLPVKDPSLLALLPPTIDGVAVAEEPESFAEAVADPDFVASVAAAAFPFVIQETDLASGVVAQLRPGVFSDTFFRDWRDSYNAGACGQAGGVVGNAEAQLGGRTVFIASCAGGLLVYHAWLDGPGVLVSLFSLGDRRFGEQLIKGLQP